MKAFPCFALFIRIAHHTHEVRLFMIRKDYKTHERKEEEQCGSIKQAA